MDYENTTPYEMETMTLNDENGRDMLLVLIKGTWEFDLSGYLTLSETQDPIKLADQYYGDPEDSSIRYASDFSYDKPATDIAMVGNIIADDGQTTEQVVTLQVGDIEKSLVVFGDRYWVGAGIFIPSKTEPFETMPLVWERAFGGRDDTASNEKHHGSYGYNPVGVDYRSKGSKLPVRNQPVPNIIDPNGAVKSPGKCKVPGGFGFIGPSWAPRKEFAGTYDEKWQKNRMPLLPDDFDFRFFNAAHPDLIYDGHLFGGEPVSIHGAYGYVELTFSIPFFGDIIAEVELAGETEAEPINMIIDKFFIDIDEKKINLVMSGTKRLDGPSDDIEMVRCRGTEN